MARPDKSSLFLLIASFIISIFLYVYIAGETSIEIERVVHLSIVAPEEMTIIEGTEHEIQVLLSAPRNILALLGSEPLAMEYSLSDVAGPGKYTFDLLEKDIRLPRGGIKIVSINPKRLTVTVDGVITKKMTVQAKIVGDPADGHYVDYDNIFIDPTAAIIKGPESILSEMETVSTNPIDVVGRVRPFRVRVRLAASLHYEIESKEDIDVMIPIKPQGHEKIFENIPVHVMNTTINNFAVSIFPSTVTVTLKGPKNILEKLDKKNLLAYVNVSALSRGGYQLPLMLSVPSDVTLVGDVPVISVTIEEGLKKISLGQPLVSELVSQEGKRNVTN